MALQSAACADAQVALFRRRSSATPTELLAARREVVQALRKVWTITGGTLPMAKKLEHPLKSSAPVVLRLSWADVPSDLDLHVVVRTHAETWQVFYGAMGHIAEPPWVSLDRDVRNGFGPETATISRWLEADYHCFVHNCSRDAPLALARAALSVSSDRETLSFDCPDRGSGDLWWVFSLYDDHRGFVPVNRLVGDGDLPPEAQPVFNRMRRRWPERPRGSQ